MASWRSSPHAASPPSKSPRWLASFTAQSRRSTRLRPARTASSCSPWRAGPSAPSPSSRRRRQGVHGVRAGPRLLPSGSPESSPVCARVLRRRHALRINAARVDDERRRPLHRGFVELVQRAEDAGEVRPLNTRFLAEMLNQVGFVTRDERVLSESGLTSEEAVLEVDQIIWDGIRIP